MKKFKAVWVDGDGKVVLGVLTNLVNAGDEARSKSAMGFLAWVQDEENNKVEI